MIDDLGLSIDGCTKETFESIRIGGNFDKFIANAKAIVAIREETGNPKYLTFCFTAMTTNIAELPGVVDLAADLGVPNVYAQPMEMDPPEIFERVGQVSPDEHAADEIYAITREAGRRGKPRGVQGRARRVPQSAETRGRQDRPRRCRRQQQADRQRRRSRATSSIASTPTRKPSSTCAPATSSTCSPAATCPKTCPR